MKKVINTGLLLVFMAFISSCGNTDVKKDKALENKKTELQNLKTQKEKLDEKITALQVEIAKIDTSAAIEQKAKLVSLSVIARGDFKHYIDLQGKVDAQNISYITPRGQPGQIKAIYVKEGDRVKKGQLVVRLDNAVALQNVAAIRQQLTSVKAQLELARSVYNRQQNLWDQHIGTEVQLLQAKTNVESLEGQLKSVQANVDAAQEQANLSNIYSDVNGTVDEVTAHVGETFNGNPLQGGYIKIVNKSDLKITVTVPENYAGKITRGTPVIVRIPDLNRSFTTAISFISQAIGTTTRGITAEAKVPAGLNLRPNQIALLQILDYTATQSIAVPLNTLQTDEKGKYVLVAAREGDKIIARKKSVEIGQLYNNMIEIKKGLEPGDQLVTEGFQGLFDGQAITTVNE